MGEHLPCASGMSRDCMDGTTDPDCAEHVACQTTHFSSSTTVRRRQNDPQLATEPGFPVRSNDQRMCSCASGCAHLHWDTCRLRSTPPGAAGCPRRKITPIPCGSDSGGVRYQRLPTAVESPTR